MKEFRYSLFARIVYRYANIVITTMLFVSALVSVGGIFKDWVYFFPLLIHAGLIYIVNRFYLKIYKYFPFIIYADNEKMICKDFMNKRKVVEIKHSEIRSIEGGIFSGNLMRPVYIKASGGRVIGLNQHLKNFNGLLTIILSNIPKSLYDRLLKEMKDMQPPPKRNKKARKKRATERK